MSELQISNSGAVAFVGRGVDLVMSQWASVEDRPAYPETSGKETNELFARPWAEDGLGREVLQDFETIAEHSRPSGGEFFGYVVRFRRAGGGAWRIARRGAEPECHILAVRSGGGNDRAGRRGLAGGSGGLRRLSRAACAAAAPTAT